MTDTALAATSLITQLQAPLSAQQAANSNSGNAASATAPSDRNNLGQQQFLELMLAQLKHQDPMKPLENGEFVAQMAQFSTVAGIEEMNQSMQQLAQAGSADRLLQAASIVGKSVIAASNSTTITAEQSTRMQVIPDVSSGLIKLSVFDQAGQLVHSDAREIQGSQAVSFEWDNSLPDASKAPPGATYQLVAEQQNGELSTALPVQLEALVTSVGLSQPGNSIMLDTSRGQRISLADVTLIGE